MSSNATTPNRPSVTNLYRDEAIWRSSVLKIEAQNVTIDLTSASNLQNPAFCVTSTLQLSVIPDKPVSGIWIDFLGCEVDALLVDQQASDVVWDSARIQLPQLTPGRHTVTVHARGRYSNSGQGLHRFHDPVDDAVYLYTHFEPSDARRAWPCMDQPDLKTTFTLTVTHPQDWTVLANGARKNTQVIGDGKTVTHFGTTKLLPTYLCALAAGPWHRVTGQWCSQRGDVVPLSWACRRSLQQYLDSDELFDITCKGLDLYDEAYDFPYPWGTYDCVLVPEYNIGAMENPGCVTFNEDAYLFQGPATLAQHESRANTILHEMCHMWFGDLVTPQWWEDTWLKESFADHEGTWAAQKAAGYEHAWVSFASRRKAWAYREDARPQTTHPIVATVDDVEAARQAFDGITYAKGASVLKQLVAYTGREVFTQAARSWFKQRPFGNGTLQQFMTVLSQASGQDMEAWAKAWLHTSGPSYLSAMLELDDATAQIKRLQITQDSVDLSTGEQIIRPHSLIVGLYSHNAAGELVRTHRFPLQLVSDSAQVPAAEGLPAPEMILVNDEDHTYAIVRPDQRSLETAIQSLSDLTDPMARALWWSTLHNLLRDALLPAPVFVDTVLAHADDATETGTLETLLGQALGAALLYTHPLQRADVLEKLVSSSWELLLNSAPGSDAQLVRARTWLSAASSAGQCTEQLRQSFAAQIRQMLADEIPGLKLSNELRWRALDALSCLGDCTEQELSTQLALDPGASGQIRHLQASMSNPSQETKQILRRTLLEDNTLSNDQIDALISAYSVISQQQLILPFTASYFDSLEEIWRTRGQEIATRLVTGMFPQAGGSAELKEGNLWLSTHPKAPAALRRLVQKSVSDLERCLQAQSCCDRPTHVSAADK